MGIKTALGLLIVLSGLASTPAGAWDWGNQCKFQAERSGDIGVEDATTVEIFALAGELRVTGRADTGTVTVSAEACVSREDMLPATDVTVSRNGDRIMILAEMPDISGETNNKWRDELAMLDLDIELPEHLAVIVHDSSGDLLVRGVASAEVSDSSGDIELDQHCRPGADSPRQFRRHPDDPGGRGGDPGRQFRRDPDRAVRFGDHCQRHLGGYHAGGRGR